MKHLIPLLCAAGSLAAQGDPAILGVERLSSGNTVVAGALCQLCQGEMVLEVDPLGRVVWAFLGGGVPAIHTARRTTAGTTLISATHADRVLEVDRLGNAVWSVDSGLDYPNDAYRLVNGNTLITDRDHDRVIEVSPAGETVWSYQHLVRPHNGSRLPNGNTLICNSELNRVVEVDSTGAIVWQVSDGLAWPRSAQRLANGNTLIADSQHDRVVEMDSAGREVWSHSTDQLSPYAAVRLANGRTLVSIPPRVYEVDNRNNVLWKWPGTFPLASETLRVLNPASGCRLWARVTRPAPGTVDPPFPAVVLVPDSLRPGGHYDTIGLDQMIARNGFAVMIFDVDGRGRSDSFPEDYYGRVNQAGLRACIDALAGMSCVDSSSIGIITEGFGITLASGMLAESPDLVRFLVDFEGPSDRFQTCADSGGPVPVSPDSESFWVEREAARFMKRVPCAYIRIQNTVDHNPQIPDNRHAIALVDSATAVAHGGSGISSWTRVNDSVMNEPNRVYSVADPPTWIPEPSQGFAAIRYLLYLEELLGLPGPGIAEGRVPASRPAGAVSARPNPFRVRTTLDFSQVAEGSAAQVFDTSGRLVRTVSVGAGTVWDGLDEYGRGVPAGVYYCRVRGPESQRPARMVKLE